MKKLWAAALVVIFATLLLIPSGAALLGETQQRVYDAAELFSQEEEDELERLIDAFTAAYDVDFVVLTSDEPYEQDGREYVSGYYTENGFGVGENNTGLLLFFDIYNGDVWIFNTTDITQPFTSERKTLILDVTISAASNGTYAEAVLAAIEEAVHYIEGGSDRDAAELERIAYEESLSKPDGRPRVYDDAGLFSQKETDELESLISDFINLYNMDFVVVTTNDAEGKSAMEYADDYFDYNGFGIGENRDGALYLIDMDNREAWISTRGVMMYYLTDNRQNSIWDVVYPYIGESQYYISAKSMLKEVEYYINEGIPDDVYILDTGPRVFDYAGIFESYEIEALEERISDLIDSHYTDCLIITLDEEGYPGAENESQYAENFYNSNYYGVNSNRNGIVYIINVRAGTTFVSVYGSMDYYLLYLADKNDKSDSEFGNVSDYIINGDYYGSANAIIDQSIKLIDDYYDLYYYTPPLTLGEVLFTLIAALIVGMIYYSVTNRKYKLKAGTYTYNYKKNTTVEMTNIADIYIRTDVVKTRKSSDNSSGGSGSSGGGGSRSSSHSSSSGSSHGGSGRSF